MSPSGSRAAQQQHKRLIGAGVPAGTPEFLHEHRVKFVWVRPPVPALSTRHASHSALLRARLRTDSRAPVPVDRRTVTADAQVPKSMSPVPGELAPPFMFARVSSPSRRGCLCRGIGSVTAGGAATALVLETSGCLASTRRLELGGGAVVVALRAIRAAQDSQPWADRRARVSEGALGAGNRACGGALAQRWR
jgi:hypothetical protein